MEKQRWQRNVGDGSRSCCDDYGNALARGSRDGHPKGRGLTRRRLPPSPRLLRCAGNPSSAFSTLTSPFTPLQCARECIQGRLGGSGSRVAAGAGGAVVATPREWPQQGVQAQLAGRGRGPPEDDLEADIRVDDTPVSQTLGWLGDLLAHDEQWERDRLEEGAAE